MSAREFKRALGVLARAGIPLPPIPWSEPMDELDVAARVFNKKLDEAQRKYWNEMEAINKKQKWLKELVDSYREYPLIIITRLDIDNYKQGYGISIQDILSEVAKSRRWLDVSIVEVNWKTWSLVIPNKPGVNKLVASLLLVAEPEDTTRYDNPLRVNARPRSWTFTFYGDVGKGMLDAWIEQCKEDKMYQLVLGFGPAYK